ncbi:hypothetical protein BJ322DRAFT_1028934 [Thelephora terrestris]|uniref:ARM repeat-containing protein n=1 Tax=Thelephora terrestris TaxID=56493 RepID=A0A9P6LBH2_9AGAM|nr:hypothetical protein BJ322DRAFT_1028934 [Thelephora terrestris]
MDDFEGVMNDSLGKASGLGQLLAELPLKDGPDHWKRIEVTAQSLANALRIRDPKGLHDQHTALGRTLLPQTLNTLLKATFHGEKTPPHDKRGPIFEILRVGANLCMDHDENRGNLLEAGFPQTVVTLLESYSEAIPPKRPLTDPWPIHPEDLKIVKTAVGVILNVSLGYEPVRTRLLSLEVAITILRISTAIYPTGSWARFRSSPSDAEQGFELEDWESRAGLSSWAWRTLNGLKVDTNDAPPLFSQEALPLLVTSLNSFRKPHPTPQGVFAESSEIRETLISADVESLEESCALLESLSLDVEDVRLSLARGLTFPDEHEGVPCLSDMLNFLDRGEYPPWWVDDPDRAAYERGFENCKSGIIRAVVEVAGEQKNTYILWDESEDDKPGGEFVSWMIQWIRKADQKGKEGLVICATLAIGNLVRREAHSNAVVNPPISLVPDLAKILEGDPDFKVKHGVIGLLKNLAQSTSNRAPLGQAGVVARLADCGIFESKSDLMEIIQVSAIGVAKHLCNGNVENCLSAVLKEESQRSEKSALEQIMELVRRADTVTVKSEGTRVLGNTIKTLSADLSSTDPRRKAARKTLATLENANALAALIGRSKKYPMLINEAVVALSFLTAHERGGVIVLDAIMSPLPVEVKQGATPFSPNPAGSEEGSPLVGPTRAINGLASLLKLPNSRCPPEVKANVCMLFSQLGRKGGRTQQERETDVKQLKAATKDVVAKISQGDDMLGKAAKNVLEAWESG